MNPEELDLISIHEAPILSTMKRIYSAVPVHHLAAIHGKIVGALAVADQMICRNEVETNEGSVNLVNFPTQRNALKFQEMARLLIKGEMNVDYCKITGWDRYNKKKDPEFVTPTALIRVALDMVGVS